MNKPYVICHMMVSIDGKIEGDFFDDVRAQYLGDLYEELKLGASDAWGVGSNTYYDEEANAKIDLSLYSGTDISYEDYVILNDGTYAVCFDQSGKVRWAESDFEYPNGVNNQVIEVVSEKTKPEFLAYLREKEISYIVAGKDGINLPLALSKLHSLYQIEKFALCGGSIINGAFMKEHLVDEISLVVAPFIEGNANTKSLVDTKLPEGLNQYYYLKEVNILKENGVQLIYVAKPEK